MKISFVVPAFNEETHVGPCLASIEREIIANHLSPKDFEIVVVNNASTDHTAEVAQTYPHVTVVNEPLKGLVMARRAGFVVTTGELVANIDSDTELPPGWLHTVLDQFKKRKNLVALSGPFVYRDITDLDRALVFIFYFFGYLVYLFNHYILHGSGMVQGGNFVIKRSAWQKVGGFDTSISFYGEDTDVARRMALVGRVKWTWLLPMYTSGRRLKQEGILKTGFTYALNFFWVMVTGRPYTQQYADIRITTQ
jgi:glycosyltransferase involved in cell wall biosynthesis